MRDDELTTLLRSPALSLEPPADLVGDVRGAARRVRRRRTAGVAALSAAAVLSVATLAPALLGGAGEDGPDRAVGTAPDELAARFPQATSSVQLLEKLNGGDVVTFYSGTRWCTGSARTLVNDGCRGYVGEGDVAPFALFLPPGDATLRVDAASVTAGVLGTGVARVEVELEDGTVLPASAVAGEGFPRPVWWAAVPPGGVVRTYTAYDADGAVVETIGLRYDASYEPVR